MQNKFPRATMILALMTFTKVGLALPIDWDGLFSVDTYRMDAARLNVQTEENAKTPPAGTSNASFQTYTLKLRPTIIVNDSASLFGEITTGYTSGGHFGQGIEQVGNNTGGTGNRGLGNALYNYSTYRDALHLRQFYAKYYSDTATYIIGRLPLHWGLGAIFNDGQRHNERFASVEDGIMAHLNIGNFRFSPYYTQANGQRLDGNDSLKSVGIQAMYRSSERDLSFGILFGTREGQANNTFLKSTYRREENTTAGNLPPDPNSPPVDTPDTAAYESGLLGSTEVKIIDLYFQKGLKKFNFELEIPILDGELGHVYGPTENNGYNAKAFIGKATYELNPSWKLGIDMGHISGDQGKKSPNFEALYLHPNYQIAHLMFRYNIHAVDADKEENIFDSYMTNMSFTKLKATYQTDKWVWNIGLIWAKASKTAQAGAEAFHHERNIAYRAVEDQSDDYGFEIDLDFKYEWNSNVSVLGLLGYHFVGDYYQHDNRPETAGQDLGSSYIAQLQTVVHF